MNSTRGKLRTKFLISFALVSALLTCATLLVVRYRVQVEVRENISQALKNSVDSFHILQIQREETLGRSAALLANLPLLKAIMSSQHVATIQDASAEFWDLVGSDLFVLADRSGTLMALHTSAPELTREQAQILLTQSMDAGQSRDWWFGNGNLFEVFLQPIYFGPPSNQSAVGLLALGYAVDQGVANDVSRVSGSEVAFYYGDEAVVTTLTATQGKNLPSQVRRQSRDSIAPEQITLDGEEFLATSVDLAAGSQSTVNLTVLKSFDDSTAFLRSLNRWILAAGVGAVFLGGLLVFFISTTITKPLADLIAGVQALEKGDFDYPLHIKGTDEVSELSSTFTRMRHRIRDAQTQLIESERLATIGRMASTISHDLRHPLTAIMANAECLSSANISQDQRRDFYDEIRIAINRMTNEIGSLLGFSKEKEVVHPKYVDVEPTIRHVIQTVKAFPEHQRIAIDYSPNGGCEGWVDPSKLERVLLNLLINSCEVVNPETGRVHLESSCTANGIIIRVADNGPGIHPEVRERVFQPFVSYGKEVGIGLGLTVVQKIMEDHGGEVIIEKSDSQGTVFQLRFPMAGHMRDV